MRILKLLLEGRIRWHSEDEQDLEEWCNKMGYELIRRDVRKTDFLEKWNKFYPLS